MSLPWNPAEWGKNPCRCGACQVCGMFGHARRPEPKVIPEKPKAEAAPVRKAKREKRPTPGLFEEAVA